MSRSEYPFIIATFSISSGSWMKLQILRRPSLHSLMLGRYIVTLVRSGESPAHQWARLKWVYPYRSMQYELKTGRKLCHIKIICPSLERMSSTSVCSNSRIPCKSGIKEPISMIIYSRSWLVHMPHLKPKTNRLPMWAALETKLFKTRICSDRFFPWGLHFLVASCQCIV